MKDGIGQEIAVGNKIVWCAGKEQYAGVKIYTVVKITEKSIKIIKPCNESSKRETAIDPMNVVVIDKLLQK